MVGVELFKERKVDGIGFLVIIAAGLPSLLFVASYFMRPIFVPRGIITAMLAYYILAGWIISLRWKTGVGSVIAAAFIVIAIISMPAYYTYSEFPRSPFREATVYLRDNADGGLILHDNKLSYFPSHFYEPDLEQVFLPDEPGSHNDTYALASQQAIKLFPEDDLDNAVTGENEVWFVVFTKAIEEYKNAGKDNHPVLAQLESQFKLTDHRSFGDLEIYKFNR